MQKDAARMTVEMLMSDGRGMWDRIARVGVLTGDWSDGNEWVPHCEKGRSHLLHPR
jgi:hypothetical protein